MKKSAVKAPLKGSRAPSRRNCKPTSSIPPAKSIKKRNPPSKGKKVQKKNVEKQEWVTVYGFRQRDINLVLSEFDKCGLILEHVTGSKTANWVHILYQKRSDAQIALSKNGMELDEDVILGVKSVNPVKRRALNEECKNQASEQRQYIDPERLDRALSEDIQLLHRSAGDFTVLGESGSEYTVTISRFPSCDCPDSESPCKHMLFVLLRVLGLSPDDDCLKYETLKQSQVARLLITPSSATLNVETGDKCPCCSGDLDKASEYYPLVECESCGKVVHESCLVTSSEEDGDEGESDDLSDY